MLVPAPSNTAPLFPTPTPLIRTNFVLVQQSAHVALVFWLSVHWPSSMLMSATAASTSPSMPWSPAAEHAAAFASAFATALENFTSALARQAESATMPLPVAFEKQVSFAAAFLPAAFTFAESHPLVSGR